jgi:hypothetical protein
MNKLQIAIKFLILNKEESMIWKIHFNWKISFLPETEQNQKFYLFNYLLQIIHFSQWKNKKVIFHTFLNNFEW